MAAFLVLLGTLSPPGEAVETLWAQVSPVPRHAEDVKRTPGQHRAVILVQGLCPHPFSSRNVSRALWQKWQKPGSTLVKALGREADIFAFAFGQNVPLDQIAGTPALRDNVSRLKQLGYDEIVMVGHSAGGLIARQFIEDHPNAGVTKVVQVCAPNGGSGWACASLFVREAQEAFLASMTKQARQCAAGRRGKRRIPEHVEFVCLLGHLEVDFNFAATLTWKQGQEVNLAAAVKAQGDGMIATERQWTADLQKQGIPAECVSIGHFRMVRSKAGAAVIARLIREKQPRWNAEQVKALRTKLGCDE